MTAYPLPNLPNEINSSSGLMPVIGIKAVNLIVKTDEKKKKTDLKNQLCSLYVHILIEYTRKSRTS